MNKWWFTKKLDPDKFFSLVLDSVNSLFIDKVHILCALKRKYVAQIILCKVAEI